MKDLETKGATGYEHVSTKVASYVSECKGSAILAQSLDVLNSYRKKLLSETTDSELVAAKKELESARAKYNKLATKYVLSDSAYCNLQTECVRTAVSEFSRTHNLPNFFVWLDNNGKDKRGEKLVETDEDRLENRTDFSDAFDTVCIGVDKFPQTVLYTGGMSNYYPR